MSRFQGSLDFDFPAEAAIVLEPTSKPQLLKGKLAVSSIFSKDRVHALEQHLLAHMAPERLLPLTS